MSMRSALGVLGQARHGPHVSADRVDVAGPDRRPDLAHRHPPPARGAAQRGVGRDRQVRLGDDHGQPAVAEPFVVLERPGRRRARRRCRRRRRPVWRWPRSSARAAGRGGRGTRSRRLVRGLDDDLGELQRPAPALGDVTGHRARGPRGCCRAADDGVLGVVVVGEGVDRDDGLHAEATHDLDVLAKVGQPGLDVLGALLEQARGQGLAGLDGIPPRVGLERADRRHDDRERRARARRPGT